MSRIVFALESFVAGNDANRTRVRKDDAWWEDDPFVQAHRAMFDWRPSKVLGSPSAERVVEQATAAPGEKRGLRRG